MYSESKNRHTTCCGVLKIKHKREMLKKVFGQGRTGDDRHQNISCWFKRIGFKSGDRSEFILTMDGKISESGSSLRFDLYAKQNFILGLYL